MHNLNIETNLSIKDASKLLAKEVVPFSFQIKEESLVGHVDSENIMVYRAVPFQGNAFIPVLKAKFTTTNHKTVLTGKWQYHLYTKILGLSIFSFIIYSLISVIINKTTVPISVGLVYIAISLVTLFTFKIGKKLATEDKKWIEKKIYNALETKS